MEEQEAIARLKRGDVGGLEVLVRGHQVRAVRTVFLITRDRALAEDIVQAAFLRAYERIGQFDSVMSLVEMMNVLPFPCCSLICCQRACRPCTSTPNVGSSNRMTAGSCSKARARASRRFIPPE